MIDADGLPDSSTYVYEWQQSTDGGITWTTIVGATSKTFTPGDAQAGQQVRVLMSYIDLQGTTETVTSAPVTIADVDEIPTISGSTIGSVTEDDPTDSVNGSLTVTDADPGEDLFNAETIAGKYGNFSIDANGDWTYTLNNEDRDTNILRNGQSATDTFTVTTAGNISETVTITINGSDDPFVITFGASTSSGIDPNQGDSGNNTINGKEDNDVEFGGLGNDTISGNGGQDALYGGQGRDVLNGGAGKDSLYGGDGGDSLSGGIGSDYLSGDIGQDTLNGGKGNDTLIGGSGKDMLIGGNGKDSLIGGSDNDTLIGGSGKDMLIGGNGKDSLIGGIGNDTLIGGNGKDTLIGGSGKDRLIGGQGADVYVFNSSKESAVGGIRQDVIVGFQLNTDKIDLRKIDANTKSAGNQKFRFKAKRPFSGRGGELRYTLGRGGAVVSGDLNGDKRDDFQILVKDITQLNASSFLM